MYHLITALTSITNRRLFGQPRIAKSEVVEGCRLGIPAENLPDFVRSCPVAMRYHRLLGCLPWAAFPERDESLPWPGIHPEARSPYAAAFLVKLNEGCATIGRLRIFLAEHPALVWLLGFPLEPSPYHPWGFDVQASVPCQRQLSNVLRSMANVSLQFLLEQSIRLVAARLPANHLLGDTVSLDTKHILAWVRENNPKEFVEERYNKEKQPKGDPDCKLGCKERRNQRSKTPTSEGQPASTVSVGTFYWGYASGIVVAKVEGYGEIVLAECTQPFNASETSYFVPLMAQVERRLGRKPRFGALDAAFDAVYVYNYFLDAGGFAAVPRAERGRKSNRTFSPDGLPLCDAGLPMPCKSTYDDRKGLVPQQKGRYVCPLLFPDKTAATCPIAHPKWADGGCLTTMATSDGARLRYQLDREGDDYKLIYAQRTASERIFSQALALGIERPKLRNQASIANCNTLTYVLLNLRTLHRIEYSAA